MKVLPIYFQKSKNSLTQHTSSRAEIIKILKKGTQHENITDARKEAVLAMKAGKISAEVGENVNSSSAYIKMPKAQGQSLADFLQEHPNVSLQERLTIIKLVLNELKKIRDRDYFYLDIKPENIFWDHNRNEITFVDWGSAVRKNAIVDKPYSPEFKSSASDETDPQRETYALAGLIGVILSDFTNTKNYYETTFLRKKAGFDLQIDPKLQPSKQQIRDYQRSTNYDFIHLTKTFNLKDNSEEAIAFQQVIENLKGMGGQEASKRDSYFKDDYKILTTNLNHLEQKLKKHDWLKNIVEGIAGPHKDNDAKKTLIDQITKFYEEQLKETAPVKVDFFEKEDMNKLIPLFDSLIEASAGKQQNKFLGSNVLSVLKKNLPKEIFDQLQDKHKKELDEFSSISLKRGIFAERKSPYRYREDKSEQKSEDPEQTTQKPK